MSETWTPKPYMLEGVEWLLSHREAILYGTMGSGKTAITLTAIERAIIEEGCKGALVCAPLRVGLLAWRAQMERWSHLTWMRFADLRTDLGKSLWHSGAAQVFFINHDRLNTIVRIVPCPKCDKAGCEYCEGGTTVETQFKDRPWKVTHGGRAKTGKITVRYPGFVECFLKTKKPLPVDILVVDETSKAKSADSVRFNTLRIYAHDIPGRYTTPFRRKWGLTGTLAPNGYPDLHGQIRLFDGGVRLGPSKSRFEQTYFNKAGSYKLVLKPGAKEQIDEKLADMVLVIDSKDHMGLPPCEVIDIDVALPPKAREVYDTLERDLLVLLETGEIVALNAAVLVGKLCQCTSGKIYDSERVVHDIHDAKTKALRKLRETYKKEPLLVMISYIHERDHLLKEFPEAAVFDEHRIADWQAGKIPMWICHPASMAHGIDGLQASCKTIIWHSLPWQPELYDQANARLMRIGQKHPTKIIRIMVEDSSDWAIAATLSEKDATQRGLMQAVKNIQQLRKT